MAKKNAKPKAAEVEELDESTDEAVEETESKGKGKADEVTFGVKHLADHLSAELGKTITTRDLRTQIRRMAREDKPRVAREVVPGNRTRYDWPKGLKDPEVKRIIKAVTEGELEEGKKAALEKLKADKAAKKAAGEPTGKKGKGKGKKGKATKPDPEPDSDDDDVDEIDVEDDD